MRLIRGTLLLLVLLTNGQAPFYVVNMQAGRRHPDAWPAWWRPELPSDHEG